MQRDPPRLRTRNLHRKQLETDEPSSKKLNPRIEKILNIGDVYSRHGGKRKKDAGRNG
jgi:hypothetical protein